MITKSKAMIWMIATVTLGLVSFTLLVLAQSDKEMNSRLDELFG